MTRTLARRFRYGDDEGIALVTVLGILFVVTALLLTLLALTLNDLKPTRRDQDQKAALAAAQAGLDDYLAHLVNDPNYATSPLATAANNPAMGPTGRIIPGSTTGARYRYTVVSTPTATNGGTITVTSIGTVNGRSETLTTTFRPKGFLDFIYMTDKENQSPRFSGSTNAGCTQRWWQGRSSISGCGEIGFAAGDDINGPMHTNDTPNLNAKGVNFNGASETSTMVTSGTGVQTPCSGTSCYRNSGNWPSTYPYDTTTFPFKDSATPPKVGAPVYSPLLSIPASNTALQAEATATGCVFSGATHIEFVGLNMKVYSPYTTGKACANSTQTTWGTAPATATTTAPTPVTVPIPNGVIYVKTYTGTACNQNAQFSAGFPLRNTAGTTVTERGYLASGARDTSVGGYRYTPDYACGLGTAYIKGVIDGQVTVGTAEDIVVTGNLTMQADPWTVPSSNDVLGLVPTHTVWVYHPVNKNSTPANMLTTPVSRIDAAILTVQDSFFVQNYNYGVKLGDLTVVGAISQQYRGVVGSGGASGQGYLKDYRYDNRFKSGYIKPPAFLAPTSTQWIYGQVTEG
jgi:Tfp pilus assembly protein PilX